MKIKIDKEFTYLAEIVNYCDFLIFKRKFLTQDEEKSYTVENKKVYEKGNNTSKKEYFYILNKKIYKCSKEACIKKFKK